MRKRVLSLILALALSLSLCPIVFAVQPQAGLSNFKKVNTYVEGQFTDVSAKAWYTPNVKTSFELGLVNGTGGGRFAPDGNMKISEAIAVAVRIHSTYHTGSVDVGKSNLWYQVYVDYAVENGIIRAEEYESYTAAATRAQFAKILAASVPESVLNPVNSIPAGSIHDLPANTDYAEAVYRLYNAGVLTGSDDYGTFKANTNIKRSEATALATRIVDPTLRKSFAPKAYDPNPPTGVYIVDMGESYQTMEYSELAIGQVSRLIANLMPADAHSGITWTSSDPSVVSVGEYGLMTAHKQGTVTITAEAYNGVKATLSVGVPRGPAELQYALTVDGKGYEVVGCDTEAFTAHIPAEYNGLPVVSIKAGAFKDCLYMRCFTVDENQTVFYEDSGVVFTDVPEKTLVVFPSDYDAASYYYVPEGTVAIASYAFAGLGGKWRTLSHTPELQTVTLPEGVKKLGDCAFAQAQDQVMVFVSDSLTQIGTNLMQGQIANIPFYGGANAAFRAYARKNNIPYGVILDAEPDEQTVLVQKPAHESGAGLIPVEEDNVVYYRSPWGSAAYMPERGVFSYPYDLTDYQTDFTGEVRMMLQGQWWMLVADENGETAADFTEQTGLYGAGYTEGEAILRAYDYYGNLIAMQEIGGNFSFCFPGAYALGVEGGMETKLTVLPVEPVYLSSAGVYPIQTESWYEMPDGNKVQYFILQFPNASYVPDFPSQHLNLLGGGDFDCTDTLNETTGRFKIARIYTKDPSRISDLEAVSFVFTGMTCVLENEELYCMVADSFEGSDTFDRTASDVLAAVKKVMVGNYVPDDYPIKQITMIADGSYPSVADATIYLDESSMNNLLTMTHETVHAVDTSVEAINKVPPSAWMEGRAELLSRKACDLLGQEYWDYEDTYDWSFLSEEDKADFFYYYYFSTNRNTAYDVGYYFLCYLNETYGEDVSAKIMANLAALTEYSPFARHESSAVLFKQCVEAATEVGVFQNFVRDVIEK